MIPEPKQILKGEIKYGLEDIYQELKTDWMRADFKEIDDKKKEECFNGLFIFLMLSAEDKPIELMTEIYKWPMEIIKEMQSGWQKEIDVIRHIHMKKYLELYEQYLGGTSMTLKLLNLWVHDFIKKNIKESL